MERDYAAQHVLIMIDTHPSMFVPCISVTSDKEEDGYESDVTREEEHSSEQEALTTPFDAALMACERLLHDRVRTIAFARKGKRDGVGVVLFGKRADSSKKNHDDGSEEEDELESESPFLSTVISLVDLKPPGNEEIKALRSCLTPTQYGSTSSDNEQARERDLELELFGERSTSLVKGEKNNIDEDEVGFCPLRPALYEASNIYTNAKYVYHPYSKRVTDTLLTFYSNLCSQGV